MKLYVYLSCLIIGLLLLVLGDTVIAGHHVSWVAGALDWWGGCVTGAGWGYMVWSKRK